MPDPPVPTSPQPPEPPLDGLEAAWLNWLILAVAVGALCWAWQARVIGPRAGERWAKRDVSFQPPIIWFAAALLGLFFVAMSQALAQLVGGGPPPASGEAGAAGSGSVRDLALPQLLTYALAAPLCTGLAVVMGKGRRGRGAFLEVKTRDAGLGVLWLLGCAPVVLATSILATWCAALVLGKAPAPIAHEALQKMIEHRSDPWTWGLIAGAVLGAPVVEELIYRGFLQSGCLAATGRAWSAIALTAVLFAAVHAVLVPLHALATLLVFGACLGLAYERTGRLLVPVTMHALFNAGNIAMAMWSEGG